MRLALSVITVIAAGCSSSPPPNPLPSAFEERTPRPPGPVALGSARPCRYDHTFFSVVVAASGTQVVPGHDQAHVTYNPAGLDVLEEAVDDADQFAFRHGFDYDAMGNLVH